MSREQSDDNSLRSVAEFRSTRLTDSITPTYRAPAPRARASRLCQARRRTLACADYCSGSVLRVLEELAELETIDS